jgi:hypothetical protein
LTVAHALGSVVASIEALEKAPDLRLRQALDVARDYAALLERSSADPVDVPDMAELPCAKDAIKHALLTLLARTPDATLREPVRLAYIRLADWQDAQPPLSTPIDLRSARSGRDPLLMASQLAAARTPPGERRRVAAREERTRLVEELRRFGYG